MSTARRIATAAAYGGGSIGLLGATLASVLAAEARLARRTIGIPTEQAPVADGVYGGGLGPELSFVVFGDSSAAGLGVTASEDTPGALLAAGLSELLDRPVRLTNVAAVGAQSGDLRRQVDAALPAAPAAAVIMIGANDVTHRVAPAASVRHLVEAVIRLRGAGSEVVVGTCPDLGTIEPIAHPLRLVARHWSRRLAAAQTVGAVQAGARTVSLGSLLGPEFAASPRDLFSADGFHPSAFGYARVSATLLPSLASALGVVLAEPATIEPEPGAAVPVAEAAVEAAGVGGTEVAAATGARGGAWALLRHLRRLPLPRPVRRGEPRPDGDLATEVAGG